MAMMSTMRWNALYHDGQATFPPSSLPAVPHADRAECLSPSRPSCLWSSLYKLRLPRCFLPQSPLFPITNGHRFHFVLQTSTRLQPSTNLIVQRNDISYKQPLPYKHSTQPSSWARRQFTLALAISVRDLYAHCHYCRTVSLTRIPRPWLCRLLPPQLGLRRCLCRCQRLSDRPHQRCPLISRH